MSCVRVAARLDPQQVQMSSLARVSLNGSSVFSDAQVMEVLDLAVACKCMAPDGRGAAVEERASHLQGRRIGSITAIIWQYFDPGVRPEAS